MPIDPMIARGGVPLDLTNTLQSIAEMRALDQKRNALIAQNQQELAYKQAEAERQQAEADAEDQAWNDGIAAFQSAQTDAERRQHLTTLARIDPQATSVIARQWDAQQKASAPAPSVQITQSPGPYGGTILSDGNRWQFVEQPRQPVRSSGGGGSGGGGGASTQSDAEQYQVLPPEAIKAYGLPEGTVAQVGPKGKIEIISKPPDQQFTPKDLSAARAKLNQIRIAKNQLNVLKTKYAALKDTFSSGIGGAWVPSEAGKAADAAVNSMRDTITSLTRTPGIGSMSDFETRLAQLKFPDRGQYESVSQQQIQSLEQLINDLDSGYREILSGTQTQSPPSAPVQPGTAGWSVARKK